MSRMSISLLLTATMFGISQAAPPRTVVVPMDKSQFAVGIDDCVRLQGEVIAGGTVEIKLTGPAKLIAENSVIRKKSGQSIIGLDIREFEVMPTGKGKVKAVITSTPPTGAKPTKVEYVFVVE